MAPADGEPRLVKMRFDQPLRGLAVGAPVDFIGVEIGTVSAIDIGYEAKSQKFPVFVTAKLYPRRMGLAYTKLQETGRTDTVDYFADLIGQLIARGLRAQARSGSLLTGRLYLALEVVPDAPKVGYNASVRPVEVPTVQSNLGEIEAGVARLVKKLNGLPLERGVDRADDDLKDLHGTLGRLNSDVLPSAAATLSTMHQTLEHVEALMQDDSVFRDSVDQTLDDAQKTLLSVKALADYLDHHPEALIKGRGAGPELPKSQQTPESPQRGDETEPASLRIEVERFEAAASQYVFVQVSWQLTLSGAPPDLTGVCESSSRVSIGDGVPALIRGYQQAINSIGAQIALGMRNLETDGKNECAKI